MLDTNTSLAPASAARAEVNGNTAYVLIDHFAFASMEPCPDLDPKKYAIRPDIRVGDALIGSDGSRSRFRKE